MTKDRICTVCAETMNEPDIGSCQRCGGEFHLQMRQNVPCKDCGDVWLNEVDSYLIFGCQTCIDAGKFGSEAAPFGGGFGG